MSLSRLSGSRAFFYAALTIVCLVAAGCNRGADASNIGTFHMGERVQAGQLIYNVIEAQWKQELSEGGSLPAHRYLVVRVSVTNSSGQAMAIPPFELQPANGDRILEKTEGVTGLSDWLGMLRNIQPAQTEQGTVVFDAPVAAYKLVLSDGGEVDKEKFAFVDIPVNLAE